MAKRVDVVNQLIDLYNISRELAEQVYDLYAEGNCVIGTDLDLSDEHVREMIGLYIQNLPTD